MSHLKTVEQTGISSSEQIFRKDSPFAIRSQINEAISGRYSVERAMRQIIAQIEKNR